MKSSNIAAEMIINATCPEDVFGILVGDQIAAATKIYKQIVMEVHPDHFMNKSGLPEAQIAFVRLTTLRKEAEFKIRAGTYGDRKKASVIPPVVSSEPIEVTVRGKKIIVTDVAFSGDICDIYRCTIDGQDLAFKIAHNASVNDLAENESKVLEKLFPAKAKEEKFFRYFPQLLDSFVLKNGKSNRRVNVMPMYSEYRSMNDIIRAFPKGIDFRDMVWMFKRTLVGLGYAHREGFVHGAVIPPHVLVHPIGHGAKIIDWCYSVTGKGRIKAISPDYKLYYAPEIFKKENVSGATDIYMAAKCAISIIGGNVEDNSMPDSVPQQIQNFLKGCLFASQSKRPNDAWEVHDEFNELLKKVVGKSKYRPFTIP